MRIFFLVLHYGHFRRNVIKIKILRAETNTRKIWGYFSTKKNVACNVIYARKFCHAPSYIIAHAHFFVPMYSTAVVRREA